MSFSTGKSGFCHERSQSQSVEWYTPPEVFEALGISFDLDPAAPPGGVPWVPAEQSYCEAEDGLMQPWVGRVWLNPPYGAKVGLWLERLAQHGNGLALVFARTDTQWYQRVASQVTAVCFISGRLSFVRPDLSRGSAAGAPSLLLAFGLTCAVALAESGLGRTVIVPRESPSISVSMAKGGR